MVQDILERRHLRLNLKTEKVHNIPAYSVGTNKDIYQSKPENVQRNYRNVWHIFCKTLYQV